jgi:metal-sulfur cluster biosynthetic enzyme
MLILTRKGAKDPMKKKMYVPLIFLLLTGCSNEVVHVVYPANDSQLLKQELDQDEKVKGFRSVEDDKNILVAIDIKRMSRFKKEKIEKEITKQLEKKFPDKEVLVTADLKIKWEIEKIIEQKMKADKLTESIEKIKSLSKEET